VSESQYRNPPTITLSYSVWSDRSKKINPVYKNSAVAKHIRSVDFRAQSAGDEINAWVREATANRIDSIVANGPIQSDLVAVSAIYLKASWKSSFKGTRTSLDNFFHKGYANGKKLVAFMHQVKSFPYLERDGHQLLQLPFAGTDTLSMIVSLPLRRSSARLTSSQLLSSLIQFDQRVVAVSLPKFEFTSTYDDKLTSALQEIGWKSAFSGGLHIYDDTMATRVDSILQKTFLRVDEDGVEAAAATAIMTRSLQRPPADTPVLFQADWPFQFFLLDRDTILFEGQVVDPNFPTKSEEELPSGVSHTAEEYWSNGFGVKEPINPRQANPDSCTESSQSSLK